MALTPSHRIAAWVARPGIVNRNVRAPDWMGHTFIDVGSRMIAASAVYPLTIFVSVPQPPDSSPTTL